MRNLALACLVVCFGLVAGGDASVGTRQRTVRRVDGGREPIDQSQAAANEVTPRTRQLVVENVQRHFGEVLNREMSAVNGPLSVVGNR